MPILWLLVLLQTLLAYRVVARMARTARGSVVARDAGRSVDDGSVSVIVPVLDEALRLGECLEALVSCGAAVREILVVDGGSTDGTQAIVAAAAAGDRRVRAIDAAPTPADWNGKAWNLETGLRAAAPDVRWIATIDADVRPQPALIAALAAHVERHGIVAASIATKQELGDLGSGVLHPAMLTTLVYRYGLPGHATANERRVQANGQCFLADRSTLVATGGFAQARASVCEDVTTARALARAGHRVGIYEAGDLVSVRMHDTWQSVWSNWPRSLTLRDGRLPWSTAIGLAEIIFVQALPLAMVSLLAGTRRASAARSAALPLNVILLIARAGVLVGTRRAYRNPAWTYWLSVFADLPVAAALIVSAARKRHTWRGRALVLSERTT